MGPLAEEVISKQNNFRSEKITIMKRMNKSGLRCPPWGTPEVIVDKLEEAPRTLFYIYI